MNCRNCPDTEATIALRSGFEFHPICDDCAKWWIDHRLHPLAEVADDYYERPGYEVPTRVG